jgi:hypothetical protein
MALKNDHKLLLSLIFTIKTTGILYEDEENMKTKIDETYWDYI